MTVTRPTTADQAARGPESLPPDPARAGTSSPFAPARAAARSLARSARVGRAGLLMIGALFCLQDLLRLTSLVEIGLTIDQRFRLILTALIHLSGFGLAGWLVGKGLEAAGHFLALFVDYVEAAARLEAPVIRLAAALERPGVVGERLATESIHADRESMLAGIRDAMATGRWGHAQTLVNALRDVHPDDPEAPRIAEQLAEAKRLAVEGLNSRLEAARRINDAELALDLRDAIAQIAGDESLHALDRELATWLMELIQKRLRSGTMAADIAVVAGRMVESLQSTPEAATLRAALPTLRRSAGLCARCAQPYRGIADACPKCLSAVSFPIFGPAGSEEAESEAEAPVNGRGEDEENPFLDREA